MDAGQQHEDTASTEPVTAEQELIEDLSLMLMYLASWVERGADARRFWKGFDFDVLNRLADEGLIADSRRAKSAYLTEPGVTRARALLARYGAPDPY